MSQITEAEIAKVVEAILLDIPSGQATFAQLIAEIPNRISLSKEDLAPSQTRSGEAVWEQRVRNITSQKSLLETLFVKAGSFQ